MHSLNEDGFKSSRVLFLADAVRKPKEMRITFNFESCTAHGFVSMFRLYEFLVSFVVTWQPVFDIPFELRMVDNSADLHLLGEAQMRSIKSLWLFLKTKITEPIKQRTYECH